MTYDKERVYDNEIQPLIRQIKEKCLREGIPFVATFAIRDDGDQGFLFASIALQNEKGMPAVPLISRISGEILHDTPMLMTVGIKKAETNHD